MIIIEVDVNGDFLIAITIEVQDTSLQKIQNKEYIKINIYTSTIFKENSFYYANTLTRYFYHY